MYLMKPFMVLSILFLSFSVRANQQQCSSYKISSIKVFMQNSDGQSVHQITFNKSIDYLKNGEKQSKSFFSFGLMNSSLCSEYIDLFNNNQKIKKCINGKHISKRALPEWSIVSTKYSSNLPKEAYYDSVTDLYWYTKECSSPPTKVGVYKLEDIKTSQYSFVGSSRRRIEVKLKGSKNLFFELLEEDCDAYVDTCFLSFENSQNPNYFLSAQDVSYGEYKKNPSFPSYGFKLKKKVY